MSAKFATTGGLGDRTPVLALLDDGVPSGSFLCNFDYRNPENAALLFKANAPSNIDPKDLLGSTFEVTYWHCMRTTIPGRQGEGPQEVVKTTIMNAAGDSFTCFSKGVLKSIDLVREFHPDEPIEPAMVMKLMATDIGKGGDYLMLVPAVVSDTPKPKPKAK